MYHINRELARNKVGIDPAIHRPVLRLDVVELEFPFNVSFFKKLYLYPLGDLPLYVMKLAVFSDIRIDPDHALVSLLQFRRNLEDNGILK